ncbi:MAG: SDR family NAD(P)-dependent oxidoreductase, partial [Acetobacteraceae bacterium]|nr:SDR family NAD(P)-dependent oxidoreductase [Acetobacteraceae bacterium]
MTYNDRFFGRRAVITGGASGIGFDVAKRIAEEGGSVCLWDLDQALLERSVAVIGTKSIGIAVNVAEWPEVERATNETVEQMGGIDTLVASAGITGPNATLWEYPVDKWRQVIDVNLNGLFYCNRAVVPHMLSGGYGRIINVASIAGKEGNP